MATPNIPDTLPFQLPAVSQQQQAAATQAFTKGKTLLKQQQHQEAIAAFKRAIQLRVLFPDACKGAAMGYYALGDAKQTVVFLIKATAHNIRLNRLEPALKLFHSIRKIHPTAPNLFLLAAQAATRIQQWEHAVAFFEHAELFSPEDPEIRLGKAEAFLALGMEDQAKAQVERLLFQGIAMDRAEPLYERITGEPWTSLDQSMDLSTTVEGLADSTYDLDNVAIATVDEVEAPLEQSAEEAAEHLPDNAEPSLSLVVVDDEPHIRMLLEETLEELEDDDVRILFAKDGQEGLETIRREKPRLVFLDVMMPRMNGYQVCERVKNDPALRGVKVIMLSAKGQEVDKVKGEAVGADLYMTKPFSPLEVLATARKFMGLDG